MLRRATPEDAEALSVLASTCYIQTFGQLYSSEDLDRFIHEAYSPEVLRVELGDPQRPTWLLFDDCTEAGQTTSDAETAGEASEGKLIGYVTVCPAHLPHPDVKPTDGEVQRLYLLQEYQGGGRGSMMLQHVIDYLLSDGPRPLWLGVFCENLGAQRLYGRHGFKLVGEYKFMVGDHADREFIMRRDADIQEA